MKTSTTLSKVSAKKDPVHKSGAGYALLFAILVSSILLSAGLGISNIIYKELLLSAIGKQSTIAFYAADTGAECALYWEKNSTSNGFASSIFASSATSIQAGDGPPKPAFCGGINIHDTNPPANWQSFPTSPSQFISKFQINLGQNGCAVITVTKGTGSTIIDSRGFNIACSDSSNSRRVERALRFRIPSTP